MVSNRRAGKSRQPTEEDFCPTDSSDEYEEREERAPVTNKARGTKRVRATKPRDKDRVTVKRHKKANLSMLPGMPIDILYEIFSLVHPKELLHISWTAKIFNGFLTSRSSRHIWQASFRGIPERVRPPPCPSGITEMAYANLVYGRLCMNCVNESPMIPAWLSLMRICGQCVEKIAIDLPRADTEGLALGTEMSTILPTFEVQYPNQRYSVSKVLSLDVKRFREELTAAEESSRDTVVEKYKSLVREREEFSVAMYKLKRQEEKAKEEARADIQQRRIDRIWEKLSEDGWHEEIATRKSMYEPELLEIKGVTTIRPLGEKAWAELQGPLNRFMKKKSKSIRDELITNRCKSRVDQVKEIATSFRFSLPHPHDFYPSAADICWTPEVRKALIDGTDEEFQDCLADIRSRMPELSAAWLEERRNVFLRLLPQSPPALKHLSLATTLFDCINCREFGIRIEEAVLHKCRGCGYKKIKEKFSSAASEQVYRWNVGNPWNSGSTGYKYSATLAALTREVILDCGENPDTITTQEMNRKHHRFARFNPARFDIGETVSVLNWVEAFEHKRKGASPPYRFLRPHELPEYGPGRSGFWGCLHCWGTGHETWYNMWSSKIKTHLALSHQIEKPTEGDYFHIDPNYSAPFEYLRGEDA